MPTRPPIPPVTVSPPWDNPDFNRHRSVAIYKEDNGEMWRYMGISAQPLGVSPDQIRRMVAEFESAPAGPEKTLAAQKLTDVLLMSLEDDLPPGLDEVVQISQDDVLGKNTLVAIAGIAGGHQYPRISKLAENRTCVGQIEATPACETK